MPELLVHDLITTASAARAVLPDMPPRIVQVRVLGLATSRAAFVRLLHTHPAWANQSASSLNRELANYGASYPRTDAEESLQPGKLYARPLDAWGTVPTPLPIP